VKPTGFVPGFRTVLFGVTEMRWKQGVIPLDPIVRGLDDSTKLNHLPRRLNERVIGFGDPPVSPPASRHLPKGEDNRQYRDYNEY
jgi:hypothetical protein